MVPFSKTIADTLYKICSGSGSKRTDDDNNNSGDSPDRQRAINIFIDFLEERRIQVLKNPKLK